MPIVFKAKLASPMEGKGWTVATMPKTASARLGSRARVPIRGTINGFPFRTSAFPEGNGSHMIQVNAAMHEGAEARPREIARFSIEVTTDETKVIVPASLRQTLAREPKAVPQWDTITPKAHAEWIQWIAGANRPRRKNDARG